MAAQNLSRDEQDQRLGQAIDQYLQAIQQGLASDPKEWVRRYPGLSDELGECLAALQLVQRAKSEAESRSTPLRTGPEVTPLASAHPLMAPAIRGYALIEEIGRGGMGVAYKALQLSTKRVVALKVLLGDWPWSSTVVRRFEREVELAAGLDHPGVVRVLESGVADGCAYYAMEYVGGLPLNDYLEEDDPTIEQRLRLFIEICEAVQYAHHHAVVHRDLKPTNIVVDRNGRPRILDFGLARLVDGAAESDRSRVTQTGQLLGTLPYLSPEQAAGSRQEVEVRTDLYALGVILYELLTHRLPYDTSGPLVEALQHICFTVPVRPSQFRREIRADLDAVVLKSLEKDKNRRYQTAALLAEDLSAYLRHEPVEANRSTRFYLLRKTYARHRRGVQLAAGTIFAGTLVLLVILGLYVRVRSERDRLQQQLHVNQIRRGAAHLAAGHDMLAESLLWGAHQARPDPYAYWSLLSYYVHNPLVAQIPGGWITAIDYSQDGRFLAYGNLDGGLGIVDADTFEPLHTSAAHVGGVRGLACSTDGRLIATGGSDGVIKLWTCPGWFPTVLAERHPGGVTQLRFTVGDQLMSAGKDGRILLWNTHVEATPSFKTILQGPEPILVADASPTESLIAVGTNDSTIQLVETDAARLVREISGFRQPAESIRFNPDGRTIAVWNSQEVSLWDVTDGRKLWSGDGGLSEPRPTSLWDFPPEVAKIPDKQHTCWTPTLAFSDDGEVLASAGWDAAVRLWEPATGRNLGQLRGHQTAVYAVAFAPHTNRLSAGLAGMLRIWELEKHPGLLSWTIDDPSPHLAVDASEKAGLLAWSADPSGTIEMVSISSRKHQRWKRLGTSITALAFDPLGKRLCTADESGPLKLWDVDTGDEVLAFRNDTTLVRRLAFSPDGSLIATGSDDGQLALWRSKDGSLVQSWPAHPGAILDLDFSPDGALVVTGGTDWWVRVWKCGQENLVSEWRHTEWVNAVEFSPDGLKIASAGADLSIWISAVDGTRLTEAEHAHAHWVNALGFLDAGRILASGGNDGAIRFWDVANGQELASISSAGGSIKTMTVTEHGRYLTVGAHTAVQLIDLTAAQQLTRRALSVNKSK